MSRSTLRLVLLTSTLVAAPAFAVVVADLHSATVTVKDQSADERARGFRVALAQVIVRLTGDPAAPNAADLAPLLRAPQRMVGEYAYATDPPPEAAVPGAAMPGAAPPPLLPQTKPPAKSPTIAGAASVAGAAPAVPTRLLLQVRFEALTLERALRDLGRAVLGPERPRTLVWLAIDDGPERDLVGAEDAEAFVAAAASRALPLAWPALDDEDRAALAFPDLVALDEAKLVAASRRHPADATLGGSVWRAAGRWHGRFLWSYGAETERFEATAAKLEALADAAFDRVALACVARFAVRDAALPSVVEVAIEGVTDVVGYARAFGYLQHLSPVRSVDLLGAERDVLRLRVTFRGDLATLERILALDATLGRSNEAPAAGALRFRLAQPGAPGAP